MMWIDLLIVGMFFLITFIIGVVDRKKITLEDYWVNGRKTGTFVFIATMFSTYVGVGAILGTAGIAFSGGGLAILSIAASFLFYFFIFGKFFAPKIKNFGDAHRAYTLPEYIEHRYSRRAMILTAILYFFTYALYIALQILGIGIFVNAFVGINPTLATVIGGLVVVLYTGIGGMRADVRTDVFQFIIMLSLLFVFLPILFINGGGFEAIANLPFEFLSGQGFAPWYVIVFAFFFIGAGVLSSAEIWQRAYAAKDEEVTRRGSFYTAILVFLFVAMAVLFGIYGKILLPSADQNNVVSDLLQNLVPTGLYGLVLAGFFAAILSSADTMILITSMTLVRDIYHKSLKKKQENEEDILKLSKKVTLILGTLGLIIALVVFNIVHLAISAISFYVVLLPSIIFGFYWKRANEKAAFWSILIGAITLIGFMFLDPVQAFIPATIMGFLVFFLVTVLTKSNTTKIINPF